MKLFVIHGPNLNLLGRREPQIYGSRNYRDLLTYIEECAGACGLETVFFQSNHEGALIDFIQSALDEADAILINPGAYTHTSIAIADALRAVALPAVEVHLSDTDNREPYRKISYVAEAVLKTVKGKGFEGYKEAVDYLADVLKNEE